MQPTPNPNIIEMIKIKKTPWMQVIGKKLPYAFKHTASLERDLKMNFDVVKTSWGSYQSTV